MNRPNEICCLCLSGSNNSFINLFTKNEIGLTHFDKINLSLTQLANILNGNVNYIYKLCEKCCDTIELVYQFNQTCLNNIGIYLSYGRTVQDEMEQRQCNPVFNFNDDQHWKNSERLYIKTEKNPETSFSNDTIDNSKVPGILVKQEVKEEVAGGKNMPILTDFSQVNMGEDLKTDNHFIDKNFNNLNTTNASEQNSQEFDRLVSKNEDSVPRPHKCTDCGKTFRYNSDLLKHMRIHTNDRPFICNICQKSFTQIGSLNIHMRIHSGDKSFKCDICEKTFSDSSGLGKHKLIHSDERPYSCDGCDLKFKHKAVLLVHKRIHTGEKPYKCDVCEKTFAQRPNFVTHKRVHTGEKPFSCEICFQAFAQKTQLNRHKLSHNKTPELLPRLPPPWFQPRDSGFERRFPSSGF